MNRSRTFFAAAALLLAAQAAQAGELSLTPETYRELALKNNSGLRQARLEAQAAEQAAKAAFTRYFPNVSATAMAANTNILPGSALTMPVIPATLNEESNLAVSMITVQQPLFAGGRIYNGNRLAGAGKAAAAQQLRLATDGTITGAERKYRTLKTLSEKKKTLEAYAALLKVLKSQVDQAFAGGLVTKTDVLRVNLKLSEVEVNRSALLHALDSAEKELRLFAEIPQGTAIILPETREEFLEPAEKKEDLPAAVPLRAEYKLYETAAQAAKLQSKMKRGEYLPVIGVGAALHRLDYFKHGDNRYQNSVAFGMVSLPISNWWEGSHSIKEARLKEAAAADNFKEQREHLLIDLENKLKAYEDAWQRLKLAELAVEEAKANRSEKEDGYKNGT
ncbi:MAG TPA: TolC family protein, partial [Elusimicrobiales bacterium]|nr:TolC family protein [Elusimicrobiales bacterium]